MEKLTRQSLGVPDWFTCDGCSGPTPVREFTTAPCILHDWRYWRGALEKDAETNRLYADKELRANLKYNAQAHSEHSRWFWWWKPWLGEVYYFAVTRFAKGAFRIRPEEDYALTPVELAKREGRYASN